MLTGYTVVVREPEWTQGDRDALDGLSAYRADLCPGCRLHKTLVADQYITIEDDYCDYCRAHAQHEREQRVADQAATKGQPEAAPHPADGRRTFPRMLTQAEIDALEAPE